MSARAHLLIGGRVQGVFYRVSCAYEAQRLGLGGWVRNLPDGRVEAAAEGPREAVERFVEWCRHGPPHARVEGVELTWEQPRGESDFWVTG
jgi:acylphosphatase